MLGKIMGIAESGTCASIFPVVAVNVTLQGEEAGAKK
jgi:hypothetical protein